MPEIPLQCDTGGEIVCYHRISDKGCFSKWDGEGKCPDRQPMKIDIHDNAGRQRTEQIKSAREKFESDSKGEIVSPNKYIEFFNMAISNPTKYLFHDNPSCAYVGIYDFENERAYFCPLERLSVEEFEYVENRKIKFFQPINLLDEE